MENVQILKEIAVQILGFAAVFFILKKLAWSSLLGAIDKRRKSIEDAFSLIEKQKKDLEEMEKSYRDRLEKIEETARVKIQEASHIGVELARDIQEKARIEAEKMVERAKAEISQDIAKARLSMRHDLVELSGLMTEKIIHETLDTKGHEKLVDQFLKEMEKV